MWGGGILLLALIIFLRIMIIVTDYNAKLSAYSPPQRGRWDLETMAFCVILV